MSFDYDKYHQKDEHNSFWTSYADLFLMLSIVFLLMFVASSLRSGSAGFQQQQEFKQLSKRAADLEQQIKVYTTLKDEQLKQSSDEEQEVYKKLMDKLSLLQEEAKDEKNLLMKKARENQEKEFALNQYQQVIRNIIDTNVLAKAQIRHRDRVIVDKNATIEEKKQQVAVMESQVERNEEEIERVNSELAANLKALNQERTRTRMSQATYSKRVAELRSESARRIEALEQRNEQVSAQLDDVKADLKQTESKLSQTQEDLSQAGQEIAQKKQQVGQLVNQLEDTKKKYVSEMESLRSSHEQKMAAEKAAFNANLAKVKMSAQARAQKIAQFAADAKRKAQALEGQLAGLQDKISQTEGQLESAQTRLAGAEAAKARAQAAVSGLQKEKADLEGDLMRTRQIANAKKNLASQIAKNFERAGIKAAVDTGTGMVTLDFGEEYFDSGSDTLKPKMKSTLDKFIPIYARSLFSDPKVSEKVANVEIIGFASSTYRGKYVNPRSVRPEDKEAINYNLKLSFGRANAIFNHVLKEGALSEAEKKRLVPMMKVVGQGYLPEGRNPAEIPSGISEKEFCKKFNCKRAQKVVVKFNMKD